MTDLSLDSLHQVAIGTSDLDRAIAFYRDQLELPFLAKFDPPGLAFFRLGETRLLVERHEAVAPGGGVLYLRAPDIHAAHAALVERGVAFDGPPHLIHRDEAGTFGAPGGEDWMAFFSDPDRNRLALAARIPAPPTR